MPGSTPPVTFIEDLRPSRVATIEATVFPPDATTEVPDRTGGTTQVRNGRFRGATGEVAPVLRGAEVDLVQEGDRVRITEGWFQDFQGRLEIGIGRTRRFEKLPLPGPGP